MYLILADAVLVLHVAFVGFVVFGLVLIVIGGWLNTKTAIRRKGVQKTWVRAGDCPQAVIPPSSTQSFARYWIRLKRDPG